MRESWFWYLPWWETFSDLCSSVLLWCVWLAWTGELGIFPCSQWWCAEIGHRRLVPQFFLSRLGTFSTQIGFNGMANLTFFFSIAHRKITLAFWYTDLQISIFNQIPFGVLIFFHSWIFQIDRLWYCDKLGLTPWRHGKQTHTFLYSVPPTWEQVVNSTKCSTVPALNKRSDKTEQDFKVGIINEDYRNNTEQKKQSGSNPIAGSRLARSLLFF